MRLPGLDTPTIFLYAVYLILGDFLLYGGGKILKIKDLKPPKSSLILIVSIFSQWVFRLYYPGKLGALLGIIVTLLFIEAILDIKFKRAVFLWLILIFSEALALLVSFLVFKDVSFFI
ncbi:MAG: hypothetical protein J7J33_04470 [Caldisericia bacterium]|nr:hypothetical protein [Caldisericia bacterium]